MGYEFTPHERIANILHVLEALQERMYDGFPDHHEQWREAINLTLVQLHVAIDDMKAEGDA